MSFNFGKLDLEACQRDYARLDTKQNSFLDNFVKMPEGDGAVVVRILPPRAGGLPWQATRVHKINGKSIHCTRELENGKWRGLCPICERCYSKLWQDSEKAEGKRRDEIIAMARSIKPVERYYYNVIVRREIDETGAIRENVGPKILSVGVSLHQRVLRAIVGDPSMDERPLGDVTDVAIGRDFKIMKRIVKSGPDKFPNYDDSKFLDVSPLHDNKDLMEKWFDAMHDLRALRTLKSIEELNHEANVFLGLEQEKSDESTSFNFSKTEEKVDSVPTPTPTNSSKTKTEDMSQDIDLGLDVDEYMSGLKTLVKKLT